ncbi:MAG: ABC transporter ATP-binding protein [Rhizobacter sp.]|nr:ABC transporter ATP-binding protein [Chlorobiales bacterium]
MFKLEHIVKHYGGTLALDDVSLSITAGTSVALIGSSGSGKSTLLKVMLGLVATDGGTAQFENTVIAPQQSLALRQQMGYVIQEGGLFPHLTVSENIALMAEHLDWPKEKIRARLSELFALTRLPEHFAGRYPKELSGGQRQRVGLMRALMLRPKVLLLDEPLGALDPIIRADLQHDLKEIFQSLGATVVLVTHDISEAAFLAETLVLLHEGRIVQHGSLAELVRSPASPFVTRFVNAQRSPLESLQSPQSTI